MKKRLFRELLQSMYEARAHAQGVRLQPLGDRLLLRTPPAPERVGALWIPPVAQKDFVLAQAVVVERGAGVKDWRLQSGARVIVRRFGRASLGEQNDEFIILEKDVLAILDVNVVPGEA